MASRISKVYEAEKYVYYQDVILGHGATSTVHLGRHRKEGTEVAVKVLKYASLAYFERENELLKRVQHKNVVQFMDVEDVGNEKWVILEWSKMGSVDNLLSLPENKFGICEEDLLCLLSDMVEALKFLSEKSVTHGDIKPRNILVYSEKSKKHFKLADFGISLEVGDSSQRLQGTPEYMHPKIIQRHSLVEPKGDLWSLAVTLLHCCNGQLPFNVRGGRKNGPLLLDMILLKPREAIGGYRGTLGVVKYDFDLAQHCRLKSNYLRRNFVKFVQSLLRVDISSIPPIDIVYQDMKAITHFHRVCLLNMTSWEFIICDIPERTYVFFSNEQENSTIPFRQRVFTELRKVIGEESLRRIVVPLDLVKENDHEIDLMLTERVLKRTSVSKPLCIYADMKLSVEHFLLGWASPDVSDLKDQSMQSDASLVRDILAFFHVMKSTLSDRRDELCAMDNAVEKLLCVYDHKNQCRELNSSSQQAEREKFEDLLDELASNELSDSIMRLDCLISETNEIQQELLRLAANPGSDQNASLSHDYRRKQMNRNLEEARNFFQHSAKRFHSLRNSFKPCLREMYNVLTRVPELPDKASSLPRHPTPVTESQKPEAAEQKSISGKIKDLGMSFSRKKKKSTPIQESQPPIVPPHQRQKSDPFSSLNRDANSDSRMFFERERSRHSSTSTSRPLPPLPPSHPNLRTSFYLHPVAHSSLNPHLNTGTREPEHSSYASNQP